VFLACELGQLVFCSAQRGCSTVDVALGDADGVSHTNQNNVVAGLGL
jgi:hypothetical protein